ncbi:MAG: hypothetical protein ACYCYP_00555 [Leptospirales bacterium]
MSATDRHDTDILLENALVYLDPEGTGETCLELVLGYDWKPLERQLTLPVNDVIDDPVFWIARSHLLDRLQHMIEPFTAPDGPLSREILKLSRQSSNPYVTRSGARSVAALNRTV